MTGPCTAPHTWHCPNWLWSLHALPPLSLGIRWLECEAHDLPWYRMHSFYSFPFWALCDGQSCFMDFTAVWWQLIKVYYFKCYSNKDIYYSQTLMFHLSWECASILHHVWLSIFPVSFIVSDFNFGLSATYVIEIMLFWGVTSLCGRYHYFQITCCLHVQGRRVTRVGKNKCK